MLVCPRCRSIYDVRVAHCGIDGERTVEQEEDPLIHQVLDRYRIIGRLGRGAMGVVYRAAHTVLRREYAIKVLFGELGSNSEFVQRLRREAETVSMIKHPNVIVVEDFGTTALGVHFLVMELVEGSTLADALATCGPFPPARVANVARQMASGLAEAHRLGLVHRDVKPSNVMLTADDTVKIMDFGVVSVRRDDEARSRLTTEGALIGTPMYMAPEQAEAATVTFAADLYSMGILLYELIAGTPPFTGTPTEVLVQQISESPRPLPPCSGLEGVIERLLEKRPQNRPGSAFEVIEALDATGLTTIPEVLPPTALLPLRARELDDDGDPATVTELSEEMSEGGATEDVSFKIASPLEVRDTADIEQTFDDPDLFAGGRGLGLSPGEIALLREAAMQPPAGLSLAQGSAPSSDQAVRTEVLPRGAVRGSTVQLAGLNGSGSSAPVSSSSAPVGSSSAPVSSSSVPVGRSSSPVNGSSALVNGSGGPVSGSSGPASGSSGPVSGSSAPVSGASAPVGSASGPMSGSSGNGIGTNAQGSAEAPKRNTNAEYVKIRSRAAPGGGDRNLVERGPGAADRHLVERGPAYDRRSADPRPVSDGQPGSVSENTRKRREAAATAMAAVKAAERRRLFLLVFLLLVLILAAILSVRLAPRPPRRASDERENLPTLAAPRAIAPSSREPVRSAASGARFSSRDRRLRCVIGGALHSRDGDRSARAEGPLSARKRA